MSDQSTNLEKLLKNGDPTVILGGRFTVSKVDTSISKSGIKGSSNFGML